MDLLTYTLPHVIWAASLVLVARLFLGRRSDVKRFAAIEKGLDTKHADIVAQAQVITGLSSAVSKLQGEVHKINQPVARKQVF